MHERSLARGILQAVVAAVPKGEQVTVVHGWVAEDEALSAESLQLHFDDLSRGTVAAGARLALTLEHVSARCPTCGHTWQPEHHLTLCPSCGGLDGALQGRTGLGVERVELA